MIFVDFFQVCICKMVDSRLVKMFEYQAGDLWYNLHWYFDFENMENLTTH